MRRAVALLIISTLLASGCAASKAVTVRGEYSRCPRPEAPELPAIDTGEHVCSPANLARVLELVDALRWYASQQDAALDCYEAQASGVSR